MSIQAATSSVIPPAIVEKLTAFNEALTALEKAMEPHFEVGYEQHLERSALEMARTDLMSLFAMNSLAWCLTSVRGEDPRQNDKINIELNRTKTYVARLKTIEERKLAPRVNSTAAKNFVRNALWEIPSDATRAPQNVDSNDDEVPAKKARVGGETTPATEKNEVQIVVGSETVNRSNQRGKGKK